MRDRQTKAEAVLWYHLRNRQLDGWKFRRQHSVGAYVLDFFCVEQSLAVELDGGPHAEAGRARYDAVRTERLNRFGIRVIRFVNSEVLNNIDAVLEAIRAALT